MYPRNRARSVGNIWKKKTGKMEIQKIARKIYLSGNLDEKSFDKNGPLNSTSSTFLCYFPTTGSVFYTPHLVLIIRLYDE